MTTAAAIDCAKTLQDRGLVTKAGPMEISSDVRRGMQHVRYLCPLGILPSNHTFCEGHHRELHRVVE
jgi:hypothetical protein